MSSASSATTNHSPQKSLTLSDLFPVSRFSRFSGMWPNVYSSFSITSIAVGILHGLYPSTALLTATLYIRGASMLHSFQYHNYTKLKFDMFGTMCTFLFMRGGFFAAGGDLIYEAISAYRLDSGIEAIESIKKTISRTHARLVKTPCYNWIYRRIYG